MGFRNNPDTKNEKNGVTYFTREKIEVTPECEFDRIAIQTHFISQNESYLDIMEKYVVPFYENGDVLSISEKIISMCQNNTVSKNDVKLGFWAKFLSKFAASNSHGIAMDEPYKLQLAINLAGLPRILFACFCSVVTKIFGIKGVFYKIAGHEISGIDGFYMNSSFDLYHNLALLNPKNPDKVCDEIENKFKIKSMIVDANDFGVEILGKTHKLNNFSDDFLCSLIKDNPAGQSDELTPLVLIKNVAKNAQD